MPRRTNPVTKRASWLAKRYPRTVVVDAITAWAEANGAHEFGSRLHGLQWFPLTPRGKRARPPKLLSVLRGLEQEVERYPSLRTTPYDRYLPWLGHAINEAHQRALLAVQDFGRLLVRSRIEPQVGAQLSRVDDVGAAVEILSNEPMSRMTERDLRDLIRTHYTDPVDEAVAQFKVVADWARDERVDLGKLSLDVATENALAWLERARWRKGTPPGETVFAWPDGWTVRELRTREDLDYEGAMMGHCVDAYDASDIGPTWETKWRLFSLRDPNNKPHATLEWDRGQQYVTQLRGKGNMDPIRPYLERMVAFRLAMLPIYKPWEQELEPRDPRLLNKNFQGRFAIETPGRGLVMVEIWDGWPYLGLDVDEDILDQSARLASRVGSRTAVEQMMAKGYLPHARVSPWDDFPPRFETYLMEKGHAPLYADDELVQGVARELQTKKSLQPTKGGRKTVTNWIAG